MFPNKAVRRFVVAASGLWALFFFLLLLTVCFYLTACGSLVRDSGVRVVCHTVNDECPDYYEVVKHIELFASCERFSSFEPESLLTVHWWDHDKRWKFGGHVMFSYGDWDGVEVNVTSFALFTHELNHERLARDFGDPDVNHDEPGGEWAAEDNEVIRSINGTGTCPTS